MTKCENKPQSPNSKRALQKCETSCSPASESSASVEPPSSPSAKTASSPSVNITKAQFSSTQKSFTKWNYSSLPTSLQWERFGNYGIQLNNNNFEQFTNANTTHHTPPHFEKVSNCENEWPTAKGSATAKSSSAFGGEGKAKSLGNCERSCGGCWLEEESSTTVCVCERESVCVVCLFHDVGGEEMCRQDLMIINSLSLFAFSTALFVFFFSSLFSVLLFIHSDFHPTTNPHCPTWRLQTTR